MATNSISIFRKKVMTNIPGFSDVTSQNQNQWFKLADYQCVDITPAQTARVYDLEHADNYKNQDNTYYIEFYFESVRQTVKPPYDILEGDYVCFNQGQSLYYYRIVKTTVTSIFPTSGCCVVQLTVNITQPRDAQHLLECGIISAIEVNELEGGLIGENNE